MRNMKKMNPPYPYSSIKVKVKASDKRKFSTAKAMD